MSLSGVGFQRHEHSPDPLNGLASPISSMASGHLPERTMHCAARYRHAKLISTSLDVLSSSGSGTSTRPAAPTGNRATPAGCPSPREGPSRKLAIDSRDLPLPLISGCAGVLVVAFENKRPVCVACGFGEVRILLEGLVGGEVGKGRVRSRCARAY